MVHLHLSRDNASFLMREISMRAAHLESELVHTDKRQMQRDLARDVAQLRVVMDALAEALREDRDEAALETARAP